MRLRNYKETVPYTIEDTLRDVHPHTLEEPFHWAASVFICFFIEPLPKCSQSNPDFSPCQVGEPVLVLAGDEHGLNRKWRKGYVIYEGSQILTDWVCCSTAFMKLLIAFLLGHISLLLCQIYCEAQGSGVPLYAWPTDGDET